MTCMKSVALSFIFSARKSWAFGSGRRDPWHWWVCRGNIAESWLCIWHHWHTCGVRDLEFPCPANFSQWSKPLIYAPTVIGVVTLVAILVFFWRRSGLGSGRAFGNKIAAHIGIQRSLFYSILDHGTKDSSRELLASLAKSKYSAEAASVELGPTLVKGIERLEAHFGEQEMVNDAKPKIKKLIASPRSAT